MPRKGENITKRKDGRWEARIIRGYDTNGKALYRYIYARTYSEVKIKRNKFIKQGEIAQKKIENALFCCVWEDFLLSQKSKIKESTFSRYKSIGELHILPLLGEKKMSEINSKLIKEFAEEKSNGDLSPKRVRDILSVLKTAVKFASDKYSLPCDIDVELPKLDEPKIEILTQNEQDTLMKYVISLQSYESFGVILTLYTGIRIGELCSLRWDDVDFKEGIIKINKTLLRISDTSGKTKTKIIIDKPKTKAGNRCIPLPAVILNLMKMMKQDVKCDNGYILTGTDQFIEPSNYYSKYQKWLKQCGVSKHSFHSLRHTFATRCVENGFDIKSLSEILGHSSITITLSRYVHPTMDTKRKNMDMLTSSIFSQNSSLLMPLAI